MIDCAFPETTVRASVFHGISRAVQEGSAGRERNEFIGNDFSSADLVDVDFRGGIDLEKQVLPTGSDYIYIADTQIAARISSACATELDPQLPDTKRAQSIQRLMEFYHSNGQKQQLLRFSGCNKLKEQLRSRLD
jgi:hypothetical protein